MFLAKTSEYALRCMAQIALLPWESSINADQLHTLVGVPREYQSKILRKLSLAGMLNSEKGHGGGFKLALPPSEITFLKILEAVGEPIVPDKCVFGWGCCNSENPCPLHHSFSSLNAQLYHWLSTMTLADANRTSEVIERMRKASALPKDDKKIKKIPRSKRSEG